MKISHLRNKVSFFYPNFSSSRLFKEECLPKSVPKFVSLQAEHIGLQVYMVIERLNRQFLPQIWHWLDFPAYPGNIF